MSSVNQPFLEDGDSSDDVSVTSTVDGDNGITYPLERIVAEQEVEERDLENGSVIRSTEYLVKWQGYSEEENTWEPEDHFDEGLEQTKLDWASYKMRLARGLQVDWQFDLDAWQERQDQREEEKALRHERRRRKRIKLGMPVSPILEQEQESEATSVPGTASRNSLHDGITSGRRHSNVIEDSSDSDTPLSRKRLKNQQVHRDAKRRSLDIRAKRGKAVPINRRQVTKGPVRKVQPTPTSFFSTIGRSSVVASKTPLQPLEIPLRPIASSAVSPQAGTGPPASMAQCLRPSKAPKKLMNTRVKNKVEGAGIFANFTNLQPQRKTAVLTSPVDRPGCARNLSSLNRIKKRDRAEPAPTMGNLELISQVAGCKNAFPVATMTHVSSVDSVSPIDVGQFKVDASNRSKETSKMYEAKQVTDSVTRSTDQSAGSESAPSDVPLMCWFWRMDRDCKHGKLCAFKHHFTGNPAPFKNELPKEQMTCRFWYLGGRCRKPADICRYSHYKTKYVASDGTEPIISLEPQVEDQIESSHSGGDAPSPKTTGMTCWYWYHQTCNKTAEQCLFQHRKMDFVVGRNGRPPTRIKPSYVSDLDRVQKYNTGDALKISTTRSSDQTGVPDLHNNIESPSPPPRSPRDGQSFAQPQIFSFLPFDLKTQPDQLKLPQTQREQNEDDNAVDVMLRITPNASSSSECIDIDVTITSLDECTKSMFPNEFGTLPQLAINYICVAETVNAFLDVNKYSKFGVGHIIARNDSTAALDLLSNNLKAYSGGAVVCRSEFTMILYPLGQQAWNFLESRALPQPGAKLRCHVMAPFAPTPFNQINSRNLIKLDEPPSLTLCRIALSLDTKRLFEWTYTGEVARNVFLMFHPRYKNEIALLTSFFQGCGAKVYHGGVEGSWLWFCDKLFSGIVLFHPDFFAYHQIPRLSKKVAERINFFKLGFSSPPSTTYPSFNAAVPTVTLTRLFPHGRALYIMDDCFVKTPNDASSVIKSLALRIKNEPRNTKILGRPGLLQWLLDLAAEEDRTRTVYQDIYMLLNAMMSAHPSYIARTDRLNPSDTSPIYFVPSNTLPQYADLWRRNEPEAGDFMADWYAGWAVQHVNEFRKFLIVSLADERTKDEWKSRYRHVDVVQPIAYLWEDAKQKDKAAKATAGKT